MTKEFSKLVALILWTGVIFLGSSVPGSSYPTVFFDVGMIFHFGEFFVLAFLLWRVVGKYSFKRFIFCLIFCSLFALSDELHQSFTVARDVSFFDWSFDVLGIICGSYFYYFLQIRKIEL